MREPIVIPSFNSSAVSFDMPPDMESYAHGMARAYMSRYMAKQRRPAPKVAKSTAPYRLEGAALVYNTPLQTNEPVPYVFAPGSIELADVISVYFDHDKSRSYGSSKDAVRFIDDDQCLAFDIDLGIANDPALEATVVNGERDSISVGVDIYERHFAELNGQRVRVVTKATVNDISLCKDGACRGAFVARVPSENAPIQKGYKSYMFSLSSLVHKTKRTARTATELAGMNRGARRNFTLNQSNRWTTERHEEFVKHAARFH